MSWPQPFSSGEGNVRDVSDNANDCCADDRKWIAIVVRIRPCVKTRIDELVRIGEMDGDHTLNAVLVAGVEAIYKEAEEDEA